MNNLKNQANPQQQQQKILAIKEYKPNCKVNYVINYVVNQIQYFNRYFESEATIAFKLNVSLATVKRALRLAREHYLIKRQRRYNGIKTLSNVYSLNPVLRNESIIDQLAAHLPALRNLLCLSFLLPSMAWCQKATDRCEQKNELLYSNTKYLLDSDRSDSDQIKSTIAQQGTYSGDDPLTELRLKLTEIEERLKKEKKLKRDLCEPLNNEKVLVMNYPFLQSKGQSSADLLGLTLAGATRIAKYSEEAHDYAFKAYCNSAKVRSNQITNPLRYYISACNQYYKDHSMAIDYGADTKFMMQHHISDSDELYLPVDQRVKVEMPSPKINQKQKPQQSSPYPAKPLPSSLELAKYVFPWTHKEPIDDISELIKITGYIAAGLQGTITANVPTLESFTQRASFKIDSIITNNEKYTLDIATLYENVNDFIGYTLEQKNKTDEIESAKMKADKAINDFMPLLLQLLKGHIVLKEIE